MLLALLLAVVAPPLVSHTFAQPTVIGPANSGPTRPGWRLLNGRWIRPAGEFRLHEIVKANIEDGRLVFEIDPTDNWRPKLISGRRLIAELLPDRHLWFMMYARTAMIAPVAQRGESIVMFASEQQDPQRGAAPAIRSLTVAPAGVIIRGVGMLDGKPVAIEYQSARRGDNPRLTVVFEDRRGFDVTGVDFFEILEKRPQVARQFLAPILIEIAGANLLRPRPADVYRVFDHILPTPQELAALEANLPKLDAEDRSIREAASAELDAIGASAVLAALRLDFSQLTLEQSAQLGDFLRRNSLGNIDPEMALGDLFFLRDAAEDRDPRVREAAREQIELISD